MSRRCRHAAFLLGAAILVLAGCGGSSSSAGRPDLRVSAASSLSTAFTAYGASFPAADVRFQFAASDALAAQIEGGARPDVYAAANEKLPTSLFTQGLVSRPVPFARNRLVIAVAPSSPIRALRDLAAPGVQLAIGDAGVPVGGYTAKVLDRLPPAQRERVLANVRSREPDVTSIVGRVSEGAVDAGFVYVTDVRAAKGALRAVELPAALAPSVVYAAAVVRGTPHPREAARFIAGLRVGRGAAALRSAGFAPAP